MASGGNTAKVQRAYAPGIQGQIHYRFAGPEGTRSPLLLLHPSPSSSYVFEEFMHEIGRDRTVFAPDLPGYGMSDAPAVPPEIGDYADAILALEARLGLGVFDIMGYHLGGLIAAEVARQQPAAVRKIVMISAFIFSTEERNNLRGAPAARALEERAAAFAQGWVRFKSVFWRMGTNDVRTWNLFVGAQRNPDVSHWGHQASMNYELERVIPELAQPLLILNPDDDLASHTKRAAPLIKNGRIHNLPGWGHGFLDARTQEVAGIVRGFLDTD